MPKKKKEKAVKVQETKKSYNYLLWGVGALILIVVVILLVKSCGKSKAIETEPGKVPVTTPSEPSTPQAPAKELKGYEEVVCNEQAAIGYKSCSKQTTGDIDFVLLHQGSSQLTGFQYYLYDANGVKIGEDAQMMSVEGGATASLTLPVSKFSGVERVEIRPLMNVNGADSICKNQHVIQHVVRC